MEPKPVPRPSWITYERKCCQYERLARNCSLPLGSWVHEQIMLLAFYEYCRDQTLAAAGLGVTGWIRCGGAAQPTVTCDRAVRSGDCDTTYRRRASGGRRYGVWYLCHKRRRPR